MNNIKTYINIFKRYNTLLLNIQSEINNCYKNNPTDKNIQNAQLIIANAASQSTILVNSPFITNNNTYSQILKYENKQENNLSNMANKLQLYEREYYFYTNISKYININIPKFYNLISVFNVKSVNLF
jgi:hypothetical protein